MISNLEKLSSALRTTTEPKEDDAQELAERIKSPEVQAELDRSGEVRVQDRSGNTFVVKRRVAAAPSTSSSSGWRT
jgi:hypothetical protein